MLGGLLKTVQQAGMNELWRQYGPHIEKLVAEQLVNYAEDKINNEDELRRILNLICDHLPSNMTALFPHDVLINKIVENKAVILAKVQQFKAAKA